MPPRTPRRNLLLGTVATLAAARLSVTTNSAALAQASPSAEDLNADWQAVEQALGATGQAMDGEVFRVSMPRSDLAVTVRDVPLAPTFALGSYAAFKPMGATTADTLVMGDLVLLDSELNQVLAGLFKAGFTITGVHNHLNEMT